MKRKHPPRPTIGQVLAIVLILLIGFVAIPDRFSLIILVVAMGIAALLLNALLHAILRWLAPPESETHDEA